MKRNFVKSMSAIVFIITMATNSVVLAQRNKSDNGAADRARADAARAEAQRADSRRAEQRAAEQRAEAQRADSRRAEQRTADQRAEAQRAADLRDAAAKASKATAAKAEPARDEKKSPALSMSGFGQAAQTKSGTAVDDISARIKAADTLRRQRDEDERRREMPKAPERQERNPKVDDGELARQAKLKADLLPRQAAREREREVREDRDNGVGSDTGRLSAFKAELQAKKAIREGTATAADARPKGMTGLRQLEDDISARKARDERTQRKLEARRQVREGKVDWGYDSTQGKVSDHAAQGTTQFSDKARGAVAATKDAQISQQQQANQAGSAKVAAGGKVAAGVAVGAAVTGGAAAATSEKEELKEGRNEKRNKDGSTTVRNVQNGIIITTENILPNGKVRERNSLDPKTGIRTVDYPQSGRKAVLNPDGSGVITSPEGPRKELKVNAKTGNVETTNIYKGRNGEEFRNQFKTRPSAIGNQRVEVFVPQQRDYFDTNNIWFLLWLTRNNNSGYNGGYTPGYTPGYSTTGYGGGYYSGGSIVTESDNDDEDDAPITQQIDSHSARIPRTIEIDWSDKFKVRPKDFVTKEKMTYDNPIHVATDYVTLEIVQENSDKFPSTARMYWNKLVACVWPGERCLKTDGTENLKVYSIDGNTRLQLGRQIGEIAQRINEGKEIDISGIFDKETGDIRKDELGNPIKFAAIVDRTNIQREVEEVKSGRVCVLQAGSILKPIASTGVSEDSIVQAVVSLGGEGEKDCQKGVTIGIKASVLQDMNNDLAARVQRSLRIIPSMIKLN